uniref:Uncharacterized protein n=1 Tax=Schistosoma haematobium TaxID=6185 RepID=A0A095AKS4_SCHHA
MVYNGQLHGFTGDWLLQDSSFSGNNLLLWLNSEEAMLIHDDNFVSISQSYSFHNYSYIYICVTDEFHFTKHFMNIVE